MIAFENIPVINPDIYHSVMHDLMYNRDFSRKIDIEFIDYIIQNNPALVMLIKTSVDKCRTDEEYKLLIATVINLMKVIDAQIGVNKLEEQIG